jgi:hypothetical protein
VGNARAVFGVCEDARNFLGEILGYLV